jgi:XTP/dITP diphosphohydrolase
MRLVLASRNPHKLRELRALLSPHELVPLPGELELPPEHGETFAENAAAKADAAARPTGLPAIADDSGIEAAALGGAPGVRSARFAGEGATDEQNLAKLLRDVPEEGDRRVAYVCALAYAEPSRPPPDPPRPPPDPSRPPSVHLFEGRCEGELAAHPRGEGGFGYDPAFVPLELDGTRTMAELSPEEKDAISHRGRAARAFVAWLEVRSAA